MHTNEHTSFLWHQHLGHCPLSAIKHISALKSYTIHHFSVCDTYHLAKRSRLPFPTSTTRAPTILQLLHTDLWGPYRLPSLNNAHYVLTIVDDHSRVTWTFFLKFKSQVSTTLINYITQVQKQYEKSVKIIRSDNGTEFVNQTCTNFFSQLGIIHQTSCPHTPQQNGVVEIKHKHLLEVARSLLFHAHLSNTFWGEAILTATHLIN